MTVAPAGTIYYTLDGSDPRLVGGNVSAKAQTYGGTIPLSESTLVKARALSGGTWSALNEAEFIVDYLPVPAGPLTITEINYDPYDPTPVELAVNPNFVAADFEFLEIHNISDEPVDLKGLNFNRGVTFNLSTSFELAAGQRAVIVNNATAFAARYGNDPTVLGEYDRFLDNNGERIVMRGLYGEVLFDFSYNDAGNWPGKAAGKGASLVMIDPASVPRSGQLHEDYLENDDNWRSSVEYGGSPGEPGLEPTRDVVVNEVLTHTDLPSVDAIELYNTGDQPVDIAGWYLSDSWGWASADANGNYKKYQIPVLDLGEQGKTLLQPGEYIVFDEGHFNQSGGVDPENHPDDFALNADHGDDVWLMRADASGKLTQFADHADFPAAANGESLGRWPTPDDDLYPMSSVTLGGANSGPRIGPLIISELMYHPPDPDGPGGIDPGDLEFVELFNPTAETIELAQRLDNPHDPGTRYLADWRLRRGVSMEFDEGEVIAPGGTLVVLSFNPHKPENSARVADFRSYYGIDASMVLAGGYGGSLDNGGELVRLQRPDVPPADETDFVPHHLEDEIDYDDLDPWPGSADGSGDSLHRLGTSLWGNDPHSWNSASPSPGMVTVFSFYWDELGDDEWDHVDPGSGNTRWLDALGNPQPVGPNGEFADATVRTDTVTVAADRWVRDLTVHSGTMAINSGATLNLAGDLNVEGGGKLAIELSGDSSTPLDTANSANLDGTLDLKAGDSLGNLDAGEWGYKTRTIIQAGGGISGGFASGPGTGEHLGHGAFYKDVDNNETTLDVELFQAGPGDVNGDARFNFADLVSMFSESGAYYGETAVTDRDWATGDFTGDGSFTFADLVSAFSSLGAHYGGAAYATPAAPLMAEETVAESAVETLAVRIDAPVVLTTDQRAAAHDAALKQRVEREQPAYDPSVSRLTWMSDYERMIGRNHSAANRNSPEAAVDKLLATWP